MRALALAGCIAICLLCGCNKPAAAPPREPASRPAEITSVVMHRSACYGTCPVYTVEILSTGGVRFEGEEHVKVAGRQTSRVAPRDFAFLVEAIKRVDFFNLHEQYRFEPDGCTQWRTDNPTVDIVVTDAGTKKHVSYYYGCGGISVADEIRWLSDTIDEVAGSKRWVGFPDVP